MVKLANSLGRSSDTSTAAKPQLPDDIGEFRTSLPDTSSPLGDHIMADTLYCSFCGKSQHEVTKLIAGPGPFICNGCVDLCHDIVHPREAEAAVPTVVDIHAVVDRELDELRTMTLTLESRIASLRSEIQQLRHRPRPPAGPAEIIGFGKPE
jgi:hypothetical protein